MNVVTDMPPMVIAQDLIARNKDQKNPYRAAEVDAWDQQKRHGGKESESGPFWAAVALEIDNAYRKSMGNDPGA